VYSRASRRASSPPQVRPASPAASTGCGRLGRPGRPIVHFQPAVPAGRWSGAPLGRPATLRLAHAVRPLGRPVGVAIGRGGRAGSSGPSATPATARGWSARSPRHGTVPALIRIGTPGRRLDCGPRRSHHDFLDPPPDPPHRRADRLSAPGSSGRGWLVRRLRAPRRCASRRHRGQAAEIGGAAPRPARARLRAPSRRVRGWRGVPAR
jgi:hypothetical protein